jgi:hypothetical protein
MGNPCRRIPVVLQTSIPVAIWITEGLVERLGRASPAGQVSFAAFTSRRRWPHHRIGRRMGRCRVGEDRCAVPQVGRRRRGQRRRRPILVSAGLRGPPRFASIAVVVRRRVVRSIPDALAGRVARPTRGIVSPRTGAIVRRGGGHDFGRWFPGGMGILVPVLPAIAPPRDTIRRVGPEGGWFSAGGGRREDRAAWRDHGRQKESIFEGFQA